MFLPLAAISKFCVAIYFLAFTWGHTILVLYLSCFFMLLSAISHFFSKLHRVHYVSIAAISLYFFHILPILQTHIWQHFNYHMHFYLLFLVSCLYLPLSWLSNIWIVNSISLFLNQIHLWQSYLQFYWNLLRILTYKFSSLYETSSLSTAEINMVICKYSNFVFCC